MFAASEYAEAIHSLRSYQNFLSVSPSALTLSQG